MALDIFSTFDDHHKVSFNLSMLTWVMACCYLTFATKLFIDNHAKAPYELCTTTHDLVGRTQAAKIGGSFPYIYVILMVIPYFNLTGMLPYVFSSTSHLAINFSMAIPIWLSCIMMSSTYNPMVFLAHFQPPGSPSLLNPFLCVIELVSNTVRPITLAVRLTANLSTGHILMGLLGMAFTKTSMTFGIMIILMGMFYTMFELAVCMVQSYIFTLLPTLYIDEHPH